MMAQECNPVRCDELLKNIYEKLNSLGYKILYIDKNLLIKTSDVTEESIKSLTGSGNIEEETIRIIRKNCSKLNTGICTATIQGKVCSQTGCTLPSTHCPMYNGNGDNSGDTFNPGNNDGDSSDNVEKSFINDNYLIRVCVNDLSSGLFLHVEMLHNEECHFKMNFTLKNNLLVQNIVDIIIFLAT